MIFRNVILNFDHQIGISTLWSDFNTWCRRGGPYRYSRQEQQRQSQTHFGETHNSLSVLSDDNGPHTWGSEVFEPPIWDSRLHSINTWKEDKIALGLYVVHIMSDNKKSNIFWGNMLY